MADKIAIAVQLTERVVNVIHTAVDPKGNRDAAVAGALKSVAYELADGGLMMSPSAMRKVVAAAGELDEAGIVAAVEKSSSRREGRMVVSFDVDPAQMAGVIDLARKCDMPVQKVMQERIQMCVDNGWMMDVTPDSVARLKFTGDQMEALAEILGLDLKTDVMHGQDLYEWMLSAQQMLSRVREPQVQRQIEAPPEVQTEEIVAQ